MQKQEVLVVFLFVFNFCAVALSQQLGIPDVPESTKEYVVTKLSDGMLSSAIVLVERETNYNHYNSSNDLSFFQTFALGFERFRVLSCLKADQDGVFQKMSNHIYVSENSTSSLPIMHDRSGREFVIEDGKKKLVIGNERWKYAPPYSPRLQNLPQHSAILLCIDTLTDIDRRALREARSNWEEDPIRQVFEIASKSNLNEFLEKYGIEKSLTNRLFKITMGNVFLVANGHTAHNRTESGKRVLHSVDFIILSSREVSELVFLAYQLDGPTGAEGYANACKRCPELLRPVDEIQTELGMRLRDALADRIATAQRVVTP